MRLACYRRPLAPRMRPERLPEPQAGIDRNLCHTPCPESDSVGLAGMPRSARDSNPVGMPAWSEAWESEALAPEPERRPEASRLALSRPEMERKRFGADRL